MPAFLRHTSLISIQGHTCTEDTSWVNIDCDIDTHCKVMSAGNEHVTIWNEFSR